MNISEYKKIETKLPKKPGVYFFKKGKEILYIGRATSIKERTKSYFDKDILNTRGPLIHKMVFLADKIDFQKTDSVLEAVILEADLIKKNKPFYNTKEKDDKSFNLLVITNEEFPKVLIIRSKEFIKKDRKDFLYVFGPFSSSDTLKQSLKSIRRMFPFRDYCIPLKYLKNSKAKPCFNRMINLCPGVCSGEINSREYKKIIKQLALFMTGKKKSIISSLEKEMIIFSKKRQFEKALEIKKRLFALKNIRDNALLFDKINDDYKNKTKLRIEAYDTAHLLGESTKGVMVVNQNNEFERENFRVFNIKTAKKGDDIASLSEILERRFKHLEWQIPNIVVIDGGLNHLKKAKEIISKVSKDIEVVSVVKDEKHNPKAILGKLKDKSLKDLIIKCNNEAHKFSIQKHRKSFRKRLFI